MNQHIAVRMGGLRMGVPVALLAGMLLALILCVVATNRPFNNSPDIRSDGVGYHAWTHALAHGDLRFCRYEALLARVGAISGKSLDATRCRNKYPPGVGLLQLPFTYAVLAEHPSQSGFSRGEHAVVLWMGGLLLLATAGLIYRVLVRRDVMPGVATIAILAFVFGSGLFHYATYDASFSHIYSAFGVALLMWLVVGRPQLTPGHLAGCFVVAAWLYLVRQTNAALSLAVVYIAVRDAVPEVRSRVVLAWLAGTLLGVLLLLGYGYYVGGGLSVSSYGNEGFPAFAAHSREVLFSYERGLFTYYPVFLVAAVMAFWRFGKPVNQVFLGLVALFALLYGSWHSWKLGAGFGHRGFVEVAPFGMLVVADALTAMTTRRRWIATAGIGVCCLVTLLAMASYWRGDMPSDGTVPPQYWRSISPVSLFVDNRFRYSEEDGRHVSLSVEGTRHMPDGRWMASINVHNGNASTVLYAGTSPRLALSWRVASPGDPPRSGWDPRETFPELAPGESKIMTVVVPAPDPTVEGQTLQFSFVEDGVFWGHDIGVSPAAISWGAERLAADHKLD